ncbi:NAD(P)-dependent oxidoreductase [Pusillimonas caeni]|uniref:NAD(P)-dependent oxidoreductase n=1 Tax=Pusillimonas caeni TaxID=1348472 RepID=UPI000E59CA66|nr:NAD(P)-dependent oxidoreductase [Pusillimonas caeni]TFL14987.1 NAD(P)-dependent oxidoreductase [Pusillimonas caeni]
MATHSQTVGMIGIGQLGLPVAGNLIQAGFKVAGFRRSSMQAFTALGGRALESPAQVARESDVVLLCLPNETASRQVLDGPEGLLAALRPDQIVIETGTYRKAFKLQQADRLARVGARVLEAEVSGSPPMVKARKAALYVGGEAELVEQCRPLLEAISPSVFHLGDYGAAVSMKLIANYLLAIHTLAAAEAMNMGVRAGFDPNVVAEVIQQGAGGSAMFGVRAPMMAKRAFSPAPGPFTTLEKYLELGRSMADELGCATPLFSAAEPYYQRALGGGLRDEDIAALIKLIEADSRPGQGGQS